jgi:hypothetical protein
MKTKTASDFITTLVVDQTPKEAFRAITNPGGWWSEEIEGGTEKLNDEFFYHYKDIHLCKMKLIEVVSNQKVVWLVLDNYFKFTKDKSEWKGTKVVFEIAPKGKKTEIKFTHQGLVPQYECYEICREAWTHYVTESLRDLIATGKGQPNAKEVDGFDAQFVKKWRLDREPGSVDDKKQKNGSATAKDYTTSIVVDQTPKEVFRAINNVAGWWTEDLEGSAAKLNDVFTVRFGETWMTMKVVERIPDTKVAWLVTDCNKEWLKGNKKEWNGTKISFEITGKGKKTQLQFTHFGLMPKLECFDGCSNAWGEYIHESLKGLITTGKGKPTAKEKKVRAGKK